MLAPDHTPHAARTLVELGAKNPGFTIALLPVPKGLAPEQPSALTRLLQGSPDRVQYLPVNGYFFDGSTVVARHYIDEGLEDSLRYPIAELVPQSALTDPSGYLDKAVRKHRF